MWTDEEANNRLIWWLTNRGYTRALRQPYQVIKMNKTGQSHKHQPIQWFDNDIIQGINKVSVVCGLSTDSLLHDLNIIKPIGRLEYTSEWIDKILAGTKTMSIRKTQYMCGFYELWDTQRQEVRGIVEVDMVYKLECSNGNLWLITESGKRTHDNLMWAKDSGFRSIESFLAHHAQNPQSVKYAITYRVVDMKGDGE